MNGPPELHAVEQSFDIAGNSVRGHYQCCVERVDVLARNCSLGVADQCRDSHLGEAEIIRDAGKAVPKNVRCYPGER